MLDKKNRVCSIDVPADLNLNVPEFHKEQVDSRKFMYHAFVDKFIHQGFELKFKGMNLINACEEFAATHPEVKLIPCDDGCATGSIFMIFPTHLNVDVDEDDKRELVVLCAPQYGDGSYVIIQNANEIVDVLKNMFT